MQLDVSLKEHLFEIVDAVVTLLGFVRPETDDVGDDIDSLLGVANEVCVVPQKELPCLDAELIVEYAVEDRGDRLVVQACLELEDAHFAAVNEGVLVFPGVEEINEVDGDGGR